MLVNLDNTIQCNTKYFILSDYICNNTKKYKLTAMWLNYWNQSHQSIHLSGFIDLSTVSGPWHRSSILKASNDQFYYIKSIVNLLSTIYVYYIFLNNELRIIFSRLFKWIFAWSINNTYFPVSPCGKRLRKIFYKHAKYDLETWRQTLFLKKMLPSGKLVKRRQYDNLVGIVF